MFPVKIEVFPQYIYRADDHFGAFGLFELDFVFSYKMVNLFHEVIIFLIGKYTFLINRFCFFLKIGECFCNRQVELNTWACGQNLRPTWLGESRCMLIRKN